MTDENIPSSEEGGEVEERKPLFGAGALFTGQAGLGQAQIWTAAFIILVVAMLAYANAFTIPFLGDDEKVIMEGLGDRGFLWVADAAGPDMPRPFALLTLALNQAITPGFVVPFRVLNILLHALSAVLLYFLVRRLLTASGISLREPVAMTSGLLFALHPVHTEAVNYMAYRGFLIASFCMLVAIMLFLRAVEKEHLDSCMLTFVVLVFALAWWSHPMTVVFPVLLLCVDWFVHGRRMFKRSGVHLVIWGVLIAMVVAEMSAGGWDMTHTWLSQPVLGRLAGFIQYLNLALTARPLSLVHAEPDSAGAFVGLSIGLFVFLGVVALYLLWKRALPGLALAWFLLLFLSASIFDTAQAPAFVERRLYAAMAGLILLLPWIFERALPFKSTRIAGGFAVALLLFASGIGVFSRNVLWNDEQALLMNAAPLAPDSTYIPKRLGLLAMRHGEEIMQDIVQGRLGRDVQERSYAAERAQEAFRAASEYFSMAKQLTPGDPDLLRDLGRSLYYAGSPESGLDNLLASLKLNPRQQDTALEVASLLQTMSRVGDDNSERSLKRALDYFAFAQSMGPLSDNLRFSYGFALASMGRYDEAESVLAPVLAAADIPESETEARMMKAEYERICDIAEQLRRMDSRIQQIAREEGDLIEVLRLQAQSGTLRRLHWQTAYALIHLLDIAPDDANAWIMLGQNMARMGNIDRFIEAYPAAPATSIREPSPWLSLAHVCATEGNWEAAEHLLRSEGASTVHPIPELALADVALAMQNLDRGEELLRQATELHPEAPAPWLRLSDIAMARRDMVTARGCLAEAERRGAMEVELRLRRERLRAPETDEPDFGIIQ